MKCSVGVALLLLGLGAIACEDPVLVGDPEIKTLNIVLPGNDTVFVDTETGVVTSGPITILANTDFSAEFLMRDGVRDPRISELAHRLDVVSQNTGFVTFTQATPFSGTFNRVAPGTTTIRFTLVRLSDAGPIFTVTAPIEVY